MTEARIFEMILKENNETVDYPKLDKCSMDVVAKHLTTIIYDSLKPGKKSSTTAFKRSNVLRFINILCGAKSMHITDGNVTPYLKCLEQLYTKSDITLQLFLNENQLELRQSAPNDLQEDITQFYRRKDKANRKKIEKFDAMRKFDQERMELKFKNAFKVTKIYYQTSETCVKNIIKTNNTTCVGETLDFREKQIKLAYALINLNKSKHILEQILVSLLKYKVLEGFEKRFLTHLWKNPENYMDLVLNYIVEYFSFVYEDIILAYCTEIIQLETEESISRYFETLSENNYLKPICSKCACLTCVVKNIIFKLYTCSFCNENVLKLCDVI